MKTILHDKDIAELIGISGCFFSRIMNNQRHCPSRSAQKLEELTREDIRIWLFGNREEKRAALNRYRQRIIDDR